MLEITNLVTSPFGIGEKLVLELLKRNETVYTVFPSPKDVPMSYLGKVNFKYGFTRFDQDVNPEKALPRKAVNLFHVFEIYSGPFMKVYTANTTATLSLMEWAKKAGVTKFIMVSTGELYGQGRNLNETGQFNPRSFYANSKFQAELLTRFYRAFEIKILRVFFPFGKGVDGYVNRLLASIKTSSPVETEYGVISPTFCDDLTEPLIRMRDIKGNCTFNVCGRPTAIEELVQAAEKVANKSGSKVKYGKVELTGDNQKARAELGYQETLIETALTATLTG
jgi:nucleoside-diphosphate-sugar epimerase